LSGGGGGNDVMVGGAAGNCSGGKRFWREWLRVAQPARMHCVHASSVIAINHWFSIESDKLMNGG